MARAAALPRLRLLPVGLALMVLVAGTELERIWRVLGEGALGLAGPAPAQASSPAEPAQAPIVHGRAPTRFPPLAPMPTAPPPEPTVEAAAERAVLEALRARRAEIEQREQQAVARETMVAAAERRLALRIEELAALQQRLEALERERREREDAGLRGLVRLYEGMRPRDAATIFDDLEMPVLVRIVDRMQERKAAPVLGAMRPERARLLTAELARLRAERADGR